MAILFFTLMRMIKRPTMRGHISPADEDSFSHIRAASAAFAQGFICFARPDFRLALHAIFRSPPPRRYMPRHIHMIYAR